MANDGNEASHPADDASLFRIRFVVAGKQHSEARIDQKSAKHINDRVEPIDDGSPDEDHRDTHYQGAEDAPIENPMLVLTRNLEIRKDKEKDEEVIDRKRQLNEIAGDKLESFLVPGLAEQLPTQWAKQQSGENQGQGNPNGAPNGCIAGADFVRTAIEN